MGLFSKPKEIIRDNDGIFRCPYCNRDLGSYIDENIKNPNVSDEDKVAAEILGSGFRFDLLTRQGLTCSCGKKLKPYQLG